MQVLWVQLKSFLTGLAPAVGEGSHGPTASATIGILFRATKSLVSVLSKQDGGDGGQHFPA